MTPPLAYCYVNGSVVETESATVSIQDRGFIFGDGVYEVLPVFNGKPFLLERHIERLSRSLSEVAIEQPLAIEQWRNLLAELVEKNGAGDQSIYIQVTRGVAPRDHRIPDDITPGVVIICSRLSAHKNDAQRAVVCDDNRWQRCDIKTTSLLANVLLKNTALKRGVDEAILVRDGYLTEGSSSNVFVVINNAVLTPPLSNYILPGVTRNLLVEILADTSNPIIETEISVAALRSASEIWLTSSSRELSPVIELDGKLVGDGNTGPLFERVLSAYDSYKRATLCN